MQQPVGIKRDTWIIHVSRRGPVAVPALSRLRFDPTEMLGVSSPPYREDTYATFIRPVLVGVSRYLQLLPDSRLGGHVEIIRHQRSLIHPEGVAIGRLYRTSSLPC